MLLGRLHLGETVHVISEASLRLSSSCFISLSDNPSISSSALQSLLHSPSHRKAWVHRGQSLELAIEISWNRDVAEESEIHRVLESVCDAIEDAEVEDSLMPMYFLLIFRVAVDPASSLREAENIAIAQCWSRFWRSGPSRDLARR